MVTFLIFITILSILIVVHEFGHFAAARKVGVRVEKFSLGFGKQLLKRKIGETEYSISAIPLGGYVKLAGDSIEEYQGKPFEYFSKPPGKRFWIVFCGPLLNYILGFLCFWCIFFAGYPALTSRVGGLIEGFGAKESGIKAGDKIIAIDGKKIEFWEELQVAVMNKKDSSDVKVSVLRDSKVEEFTVKIKEKQLPDELGQKRSFGLLGITQSDEFIKVKHGFAESFLLGFNRTKEITAITYKALWRMVTAKLSIKEASGPLGIYFITSKVAQQGFLALLNLLGLISVSLAIFNLLPFPILDGGHILLLAVEKIRGKVLGIKAERIITQIGFTFIITLTIIVTYNDILRNFGDKISRILK